jgi:hypothetical protein
MIKSDVQEETGEEVIEGGIQNALRGAKNNSKET